MIIMDATWLNEREACAEGRDAWVSIIGSGEMSAQNAMTYFNAASSRSLRDRRRDIALSCVVVLGLMTYTIAQEGSDKFADAGALSPRLDPYMSRGPLTARSIVQMLLCLSNEELADAFALMGGL